MYQLNMFFVLIQRRVEEGTILYVGEVSIHGSFDHEYHIKAQIRTWSLNELYSGWKCKLRHLVVDRLKLEGIEYLLGLEKPARLSNSLCIFIPL